MAKWMIVFALALLALHFGEAMAAPSPTSLVSVSGTDMTHLIGSKKKGSATTNSDQTRSATQKKKGSIFYCSPLCTCGCILGTCKGTHCLPKAMSQ